MKIRVLTGLIGGIFGIILLTVLPIICSRVAASFFCAIVMYELLSVVKLQKNKAILAVTVLFAAGAPFLDMLPDMRAALAVLIVYGFLLAVIQLACNQTLRTDDTMFVIATSVLIVLPIASLAYLAAMPTHGRAYVFLALVIAWFADMGAYFVGTFLGKHKLCPNISPKKTIEGLIGGMVSAVLLSLFCAWIYQTFVLGDTATVVYWQVALVSFLLSPLTVMGDLFCSVIKRQKGIKDYGNLFPGHGGALDRFDSTIFVAPVLCIVCSYMSMIV